MAGWTFEVGVRADVLVRHLWLNTLGLALSLTVIGAPAAIVAMHAVIDEWDKGDARGVAARFIAAVRVHGLRASALGLIWSAAMLLLLVNAAIVMQMDGVQRAFLLGLLAAAGLTLMMLGVGVPFALVRGARGWRMMLQLAGSQVTAHPLVTCAAVVLLAGTAIASVLIPFVLLVAPAPIVHLLHSFRTGRLVLTLPRTRLERTYA